MRHPARHGWTVLWLLAAGGCASRDVIAEPRDGAVALDSLYDIPPGYWYEVPHTALVTVAVAPPAISAAHYDSIRGDQGIAALMTARSGGALDTSRNRLLVWGGGRQAYGGNEVYAFSVPDLAWERLTLPSQGPFGDDVLPDGTPAARHSFDQLEYVPPPADKLYARGGVYFPTSNMSPNTFLLDLATLTWSRGTPMDSVDFGAGNMTAYDPVTGLVWEHGNNVLWSYDVATDVWTARSDVNVSQGLGGTLALDPVRRKLVRVGAGLAVVWDLSIVGVVPVSDLLTTGANEIQDCYAPGVDYDAGNDRLTAWCSGGDVYSLDLDRRVWTRHAPRSSVNPGDPFAVGTDGTYGRFRYLPEAGLFVVVTHVEQNVFFYRPAER